MIDDGQEDIGKTLKRTIPNPNKNSTKMKKVRKPEAPELVFERFFREQLKQNPKELEQQQQKMKKSKKNEHKHSSDSSDSQDSQNGSKTSKEGKRNKIPPNLQKFKRKCSRLLNYKETEYLKSELINPLPKTLKSAITANIYDAVEHNFLKNCITLAKTIKSPPFFYMRTPGSHREAVLLQFAKKTSIGSQPLVYSNCEQKLFNFRLKKYLLNFDGFQSKQTVKEQKEIEEICADENEKEREYEFQYDEFGTDYENFELDYGFSEEHTSTKLFSIVKKSEKIEEKPKNEEKEILPKNENLEVLDKDEAPESDSEQDRWFVYLDEQWDLIKSGVGIYNRHSVCEMHWLEIFEPLTRTCIKCWRKDDAAIWDQDGDYKVDLNH